MVTAPPEPNFGKTAADYATHRAGFPPAFFDELERRGWLHARQTALDIGTGTGTIGRQLAARGLRVSALDPAPELLEKARALSRAASLEISFIQGRAEELPFSNEEFGIVFAGQCWHWFDRVKAAAEARRVLSPLGRIVICHFDWLPLKDNVVGMTERLIQEFNPPWTMAGGTGIYPQWLGDLADAGFHSIETFSFDVVQNYSQEAWRGRVRASAGIAASLPAGMVAKFDEALANALQKGGFGEPLEVPHRVWAVSALK